MQKRPVEIIMTRSCPFPTKARCRSSSRSTRHMTIDHQQCAGLSPMCDAINHQWTTFIKQLSQICHQLVAQSTMLMRGVSRPQFLNAQGTKIDATTQIFKSARESFFVVTVNRSILWSVQCHWSHSSDKLCNFLWGDWAPKCSFYVLASPHASVSSVKNPALTPKW